MRIQVDGVSANATERGQTYQIKSVSATTVTLTAKTTVSGTETTEKTTFVLPIASADVTNAQHSPPGERSSTKNPSARLSV